MRLRRARRWLETGGFRHLAPGRESGPPRSDHAFVFCSLEGFSAPLEQNEAIASTLRGRTCRLAVDLTTARRAVGLARLASLSACAVESSAEAPHSMTIDRLLRCLRGLDRPPKPWLLRLRLRLRCSCSFRCRHRWEPDSPPKLGPLRCLSPRGHVHGELRHPSAVNRATHTSRVISASLYTVSMPKT